MENPAFAPQPTVDDLTRLRWLSIAHYIYAGFIALFSPFAQSFVFRLYSASPALQQRAGGFSPKEIFVLLSEVSGVLLILGLGIATLVFFCGRNIGRHRNHTYCIVMAGIECLSAPIGTLLGVFTLIVLLRPSVKALFQESSAIAGRRDAI